MIPGTLSWNDSSNNKAYASGDIGLTFNGVSIYYVLKNSPDPRLQAIAADTSHPGCADRLGASGAAVVAGGQRHGVQAHQISERLQGIPALHDGGADNTRRGWRAASATGRIR